jgi:branched-chain amino acid transport system substrate-binding protein
VRKFHHTPRVRFGLSFVAVLAVLFLAACGSSKSSSSTSAAAPAASSSSSTSASSAPTSASTSTSSCGPKPGTKATGTPIPLGAINTKQPGTDFTDIENMEGAYFACVNANGGVNGHPIVLYKLTEPTQPAQIAADATKLVQSDKVVGESGNSSILECTINHAYWEKQNFFVIAAGIAPECYSTPNIADVNMGPRYSSDGAVQYVLSLHPSKIVFDQSNVPGTGYIAAGPAAVAGAAHVPITQLTENVPINDANSVALKEVDDAGPNGAVVLNFTPPEALVILQAAQKLGLENRVKAWACSTPCNTDFLAQSLGSKWNGKFFVNAELADPDATTTPTMNLYKAILKQYGTDVSGGIGSFSEMGFTMGEIATHALESIKGPYTTQSVNAAFKGVKNYDTGMLCQLWTFGSYPLHIPNNQDYTVTPSNGKMVIKQGCTNISSVDPQIAQYRSAAGTAATAPGQPAG